MFRRDQRALLSAAKMLLPDFRVSSCLSRAVKSFPNSDPASDALMQCKSAWVCPYCSGSRARQVSDELRPLAEKFMEQGGGAYFATMSFRHEQGEKLDVLLDAVAEGRRIMQQSYSYKKFMLRAGRLGSVRALEMTHGKHGWHVHTHDLGFLWVPLRENDPGAGLKFSNFERRGCAFWRESARRAGRVTDVASYHVQRVARADFFDGWDAVTELTSAHLKAARPPGRTPMQLLHGYLEGDRTAGELFQEYARTTRGQNYLVWSHGLRERLIASTRTESIEDDLLEVKRVAGGPAGSAL